MGGVFSVCNTIMTENCIFLINRERTYCFDTQTNGTTVFTGEVTAGSVTISAGNFNVSGTLSTVAPIFLGGNSLVVLFYFSNQLAINWRVSPQKIGTLFLNGGLNMSNTSAIFEAAGVQTNDVLNITGPISSSGETALYMIAEFSVSSGDILSSVIVGHAPHVIDNTLFSSYMIGDAPGFTLEPTTRIDADQSMLGSYVCLFTLIIIQI